MQVLVGPMGLMSCHSSEQFAAIHSLSTLMLMIPSDIFLEFEKVSFFVNCGVHLVK